MSLREQILNRIQTGFPVTLTPFNDLAVEFGVTPDEVISEISTLKSEGIIRRIGATIDSRKVGFKSTLVACMTDPGKITKVAAEIGKHPGVTHSYQRGDKYNLWFTLIAPDIDSLNAALECFSKLPGIIEIHSLPAVKIYKIKVEFRGAE
jgi:siroheme decarboxylase